MLSTFLVWEASMKRRSRRQFLKETVTAGTIAGSPLLASESLVAGPAPSGAKAIGANDRIRVGLIGCGGMGRGDLRDFLQVKNTECAALCDVDDEQSAKAMKEVIGDVPQKPGLVTKDFRKALDQKDIDAVIVATPDHWHALPTIMACQAGKDVYVEKPLAYTVSEGRAMVEAARRTGRIVQIGTQQRSGEHYHRAVAMI